MYRLYIIIKIKDIQNFTKKFCIQALDIILESFCQYLSLFTREKIFDIANMERKAATFLHPNLKKFNFIDNDAERIDEL